MNKLSNDPPSAGTRALPWFAGWQRMGTAAWLDMPRNVTTDPDGAPRADLAALICRGPVDAVTQIWVNDQEVWSGLTARGGEASIAVDLGDWGAGTLFWGRADQDFQPDLQAVGQPTYRGQCYLYLPQFRLDADGPRAPRIELALQRAPVAPWLAAASGVPGTINGDANPAHALAEILGDAAFGIGLDAADFDQTAWATCATRLAAEELGCSPLLDQDMSAREFAAALCGHFGGFLRWTAEGRLRLGLWRAPADASALPVLTVSHLTRPAEIAFGSWSETFSRTTVACRERARDWTLDCGQWQDDGGALNVGQPRALHLERPWITRRDTAAALASRFGRAAALPRCAGRLRARASAIEGIEAGDWLRLEAGAAGPGATLTLQCIARRTLPDNAAEVELAVAGSGLGMEPAA